jgi:hypothetical protein
MTVAAAVVVSVHVLVLGVIKLKIKPNAETVQLIVFSLWVLGTNQARTVMVRIWHEHIWYWVRTRHELSWYECIAQNGYDGRIHLLMTEKSVSWFL